MTLKITIELAVDLGDAFTASVVNSVSEMIRHPATLAYGAKTRQPGYRGVDDPGSPAFMVNRNGTITSIDWPVADPPAPDKKIGTWAYGEECGTEST